MRAARAAPCAPAPAGGARAVLQCARRSRVDYSASTFTYSASHFITASEAGRPLTPEESILAFIWENEFPVEERVLIGVGEIEADFVRFKAEALQKLRAR